jgi:hypothetical protein
MSESSAYEMAVRNARTSAATSPVHISPAVDTAPFIWAACNWKVVQRKAPGAISAMAFTVRDVRFKVLFIPPDDCTLVVFPELDVACIFSSLAQFEPAFFIAAVC